MQFQLLLRQNLQNSQQYKQLRRQFEDKQLQCLRQAQNEVHRAKCTAKARHFEDYLRRYRTQFKQKGRTICSQAMSAHQNLDQKIKIKDQCFAFYAKSLPLFHSNVTDKLKSLVHNIDFSEL